MSIRISVILLIPLAVWAEVVDLAGAIDPARAERIVGEWTYDVWNAGMPPGGGTMTVQGRKEGEGYLLETSIQVPDEVSGLVFVGEALALGKDLKPTGYSRSNFIGEGADQAEVSSLSLSWGPSGAVVQVGEKSHTLDAGTLPDAVLPHWLALVPLDAARAYRASVLSFAGGPHAAAAMLRCEGTREEGGKPCTRWLLRPTNEDPAVEMKWWVDAEGVVAFRCGSLQGVRKGTSSAALPMDGDLDPKVTFRMTPESAEAGAEVRQFTFEDSTYRRGAVVAMKTQYSVDDSAHGRVMDVRKGDRVVALVRHFSLGNPTREGDEWSMTLALSLPGLEAGKSYDLANGEAEGILHYGSRGPQTPGELISREATGQVKVLGIDGPTLELELSLTFQGQVIGSNVGRSRFDVQGTVVADLSE